LQHTIDYSKAYDRIRGIVEGPTCSLIEVRS
jgi:dihydroneopterin aldolase